MNIQDMIPLEKILLSVKHTGFEQTILFLNPIDNLPVLAGFFLPTGKGLPAFSLRLIFRTPKYKSLKFFRNE